MKVYKDLGLPSHASVERALKKDDRSRLYLMVIGIALHDPDFAWAQALCVTLSRHEDETIRGNATLGFGHLARRFGKLDRESVRIVERGLRDASEHVSGQAWAAADDIVHFLKVKVKGFKHS